MIALHENQPCWVDVNIEASTRQKRRRPKVTHRRRWFNPPSSEDVGRHILQEAMMDKLVSKQNLLIRNLAPSRVVDYRTVNPIDLAAVSGGAGHAMVPDSPSDRDDMMASSFY